VYQVPAPLRLKTGNQRLDQMPRPADLGAFVDVLDPAGHRLVRLGRMFDEPDPEGAFYSADTVGDTTRMVLEPQPTDPDRLGVLRFTCKTCRDQGAEPESSIDAVVLRQHIDRAWAEGKSRGDTPTRHSVQATPRGYAGPQ
jgi:hypothetical protein